MDPPAQVAFLGLDRKVPWSAEAKSPLRPSGASAHVERQCVAGSQAGPWLEVLGSFPATPPVLWRLSP